MFSFLNYRQGNNLLMAGGSNTAIYPIHVGRTWKNVKFHEDVTMDWWWSAPSIEWGTFCPCGGWVRFVKSVAMDSEWT